MALTLLVTVEILLFNFLIIYGIMSSKDLESVKLTLKAFHKKIKPSGKSILGFFLLLSKSLGKGWN